MTGSCCNDIFTCHAELIHAAAEIQFATGVTVTDPSNSDIQTIEYPNYFLPGDTVDVFDVDNNNVIISTLASGLTVIDNDKVGKLLTLSSIVDTTLATGTAKIRCRNISNVQTAVDRLYHIMPIIETDNIGKLQTVPGFQDLKTYAIAPDSVVRLEITLVARDIDNTSRASFTRVGLFYREGTGECKHQKSFWQTVDTLKSHVTMDIDYILGAEAITIRTKNAGNIDTWWVGTSKRIVNNG